MPEYPHVLDDVTFRGAALRQVNAAIGLRAGKVRRVAGLGDSITYGNSSITATVESHGATSFLTMAALHSGGRMQIVRNAGVGGHTTAQMFDRLATDVLAYDPDACIVEAGTNDSRASAAARSGTIATLRRIWAALAEAGVRPIATTLTPRLDFSPAMSAGETRRFYEVNDGIRRAAETDGVFLIDLHRAGVDPADGGFVSGYSTDGLHPIAAGADALGAYVAAQLDPVLAPEPPFPHDKADTANLLANGVFVTDTNADGVADSWGTLLGTGGGGAAELVAMTADEGLGNWQQVSVTSSAQRYVQVDVSTGLAAGDRIAFMGKIQTEGLNAGLVPVFCRALARNVSTVVYTLEPAFGLVRDLTGGWYMEMTLPANTTNVRVLLGTTTGGTAGEVRFGQVALRNLTTLGIA